MSHELRTPMNAILGFSEMLLDGLYGEVPVALKEPLADIQVNGRHLLRLINDVLDLSKIEAGRMTLALGEYSVREVIDIAHVSLRSLAAEKGLGFTTSVPDGLPVAYGDSGRLTQCLMNLAGNAIKFTRQGQIQIGAELAADELIYRVSDTGIGIPKEELENVFAEFRQVDAAPGIRGTGRAQHHEEIRRMHGGRIWVESDREGLYVLFAVPLRTKARAYERNTSLYVEDNSTTADRASCRPYCKLIETADSGRRSSGAQKLPNLILMDAAPKMSGPMRTGPEGRRAHESYPIIVIASFALSGTGKKRRRRAPATISRPTVRASYCAGSPVSSGDLI
jgi:hypothetical protein